MFVQYSVLTQYNCITVELGEIFFEHSEEYKLKNMSMLK